VEVDTVYAVSSTGMESLVVTVFCGGSSNTFTSAIKLDPEYTVERFIKWQSLIYSHTSEELLLAKVIKSLVKLPNGIGTLSILRELFFSRLVSVTTRIRKPKNVSDV
jgi:hypothetical protein